MTFLKHISIETRQLKGSISSSEEPLITMNTNQQVPSNSTTITGMRTNINEFFIHKNQNQ